ncbi:MAG TPA: DUF4012 domain-containing protein, partial [Ilumatobacteraceae bacterium]
MIPEHRNEVRPEDVPLVMVATIAAGLAAVAVHVSPTGSRSADIAVTFVLAAFVAWIGASSPWWLLIALGALGSVGTATTAWMLPAIVVVVVGIGGLAFHWTKPWLRSAAVGCGVVALFHLRINPFFGASAVIAGIAIVVVVAVAYAQREAFVRRWVRWGVVAVGAFLLLAVAGIAVAGVRARHQLSDGYDHLNDGLDQLRAGDTAAAAVSLRAAAKDLDAANHGIHVWWARPAALVPFVGQHRVAFTQLLSATASSTDTAASALATADFNALQVQQGSIDVAALAALAPPLQTLSTVVHHMDDVLHDTRSPWLIGPVQTALHKAESKLAGAETQADAIAATAKYGPAMLGSDGARSYLVAFTSPAEGRAQSGSIVDWAQITITDGHLTQSGFGPISDLVSALTTAAPLQLDAPADYFARYGQYGAGTATTPATAGYWANVTMSPDLPTDASVMSQMYAGAGRGQVDGVFVLDPTALSSMLRVSGPVTVPGINEPVTADALLTFLLVDQFTLDPATRATVVNAVAGITLNQFLAASLPPAQQLAGDLGPAATEGHISAWARRSEEEGLLQLVGMADELPAPAGRDGLAVTTNNLAGNDTDNFLQRSVAYTASYDAATGHVSGDVGITLHSSAPGSGYPDDVIGNALGLAPGTNRTLLTVYTPLTITGATIDGVTVTT